MADPVRAAILSVAAVFVALLLATALRGRRPAAGEKGPGDMQVRGPGLRSSLAMFPIALVAAVIVFAAAPVYFASMESRQKALLRGLWDRSAVLLETLSGAASGYLSRGDAEGLAGLVPLMSAVPEARFVTILGGGPARVVWASNDPDILSGIDTPELLPGVSRLARDGPDVEPGRVVSEPEFAFDYSAHGPRFFVLSRAAEYRDGAGCLFVGLVALGICSGPAMAMIRGERERVRRRVLALALAAFAFGLAGAFSYSSLATIRVRRLLGHARLVLDTLDERSLSRMETRIRGRDEIAAIGNVLNGITQRLAKTATMAAGLSAGKKLQRKLLPLDVDADGNTFDYSYREIGSAIFFAYYEEAEEISGDYFDYRNLDGRYFAVIKCDVAGTGVPAALITMQISTMFRSYFWAWQPGMVGHMDELVYMINDFIESVGARRRFAAFTLCVFDSKTGDTHFCNAGDNTIHVFDSHERRIKSIFLPETPAAGILPYEMVVSKGGYRVQTFTLGRGDILFLHTDGLEESMRRYRGPVFDGRTCVAGANRIPHGNYIAGRWGEELGGRGIYGVVDAVMNRGSYRLHKWHTPEGREEFLRFDFSRCRGGVEEAIIALAAVEKMFRCYRAPDLTVDDRVLVDAEIDAFLRSHFLEYHEYCAHTAECPGDRTHLYYTHMREDHRRDDLAILGIERK